MTVSEYGNHWRMDDPTEICEEDDMSHDENCGDEVNMWTDSGLQEFGFFCIFFSFREQKSTFIDDLY